MDLSEITRFVTRKWDDDIVARLVDYVQRAGEVAGVRRQLAAHGELAAVVVAARDWARQQPIAGLVARDRRTPGPDAMPVCSTCRPPPMPATTGRCCSTATSTSSRR